MRGQLDTVIWTMLSYVHMIFSPHQVISYCSLGPGIANSTKYLLGNLFSDSVAWKMPQSMQVQSKGWRVESKSRSKVCQRSPLSRERNVKRAFHWCYCRPLAFVSRWPPRARRKKTTRKMSETWSERIWSLFGSLLCRIRCCKFHVPI